MSLSWAYCCCIRNQGWACYGWRTKCSHQTDQELTISFMPSDAGLGNDRPATIRPPITFIAEIFFHGEETYMLLRPEMKGKGVPRPHCSFLYLSLNNLRNHSLEEE